MLSFFLRIMRQRSGGSNYVCVQLLQTLNILFENIRNETSLCKCFALSTPGLLYLHINFRLLAIK